VDVVEIECGYLDWIQLAQGTMHWRAVLYTTVNHRIPAEPISACQEEFCCIEGFILFMTVIVKQTLNVHKVCFLKIIVLCQHSSSELVLSATLFNQRNTRPLFYMGNIMCDFPQPFQRACGRTADYGTKRNPTEFRKRNWSDKIITAAFYNARFEVFEEGWWWW
jgi:hypothetical protein